MRLKCSETSGIAILLIGIALLLTTFVIASIHLQGEINVLPVPSFLSSFGKAFSPLIEASIRVLYLGLMGWIAITVTAKGLNVILHAKLNCWIPAVLTPENNQAKISVAQILFVCAAKSGFLRTSVYTIK